MNVRNVPTARGGLHESTHIQRSEAGTVRGPKDLLVTTYRRDGTPVAAPVSIALDGDHAFVRTFEKAGKTKRLRYNAAVEVTPCTTVGKPTSPPIKARARRLDGAEHACAGRLLRRKYPLLQGVMVPWTHRLMRNKTGRTVHFALTPTEQVGDHGPLPVLVTPPGVH